MLVINAAVAGSASRPVAAAAMVAMFSCRSDSQSSTRSATARDTLSLPWPAAEVKLVDDLRVSTTASMTLIGNDATNTPTTNRYR